MASASYYAGIANKYLYQIHANTKIKNQYTEAMNIIQKLASGLTPVDEDLISAEKSCADGGFVQDGEPYGQGKFKECYTAIEKDISSLNSVISNLSNEIENLNTLIEADQARYAVARKNMFDALVREKEAQNISK